MLRNTTAGIVASRLNRVLMAPEGTEPTSGGAAPNGATPPPVVTAPPAPAPQPPPVVNHGEDGKPITISSREFKRFKDEAAKAAEKRATAAAQAAQEQLAKSLGYKSHAEMVEGAKRAKQRPAQQANPTGDPKADKQLADLRHQLEGEKSLRLKATAKIRALERDLMAYKAQASIEKELVRYGVQHVDFAYNLVEKKLASLTAGKANDQEIEAAMATFDTGKFINEELRTQYPFLFQVQQVPANTGPGAATTPPPAAPKPGSVTRQTTDQPAVDVRKMTPQEFAEYKRKKGLGKSSF